MPLTCSNMFVVGFKSWLEHPWIQNAKKAPNVPLGDIVRTRLKQFSIMNKLKKKALRVSFVTSIYIYFMSKLQLPFLKEHLLLMLFVA